MQQQQSMIVIQASIVNRLIKSKFPQKIITSEFKKEFNQALSIFILYIQNVQNKKRYSKDDVVVALEQQGFGTIAEKLRNYNLAHRQNEDVTARKKPADQ